VRTSCRRANGVRVSQDRTGRRLRLTVGESVERLSSSRAPDKTGERLRMKESYGEGVAIHTGPESCADVRKGVGEALTGEHAGWALSRENESPHRGADALRVSGRPHSSCRHRETRRGPARSETPGMHGNLSSGNREIPRSPAAWSEAGRIGKSKDTRR